MNGRKSYVAGGLLFALGFGAFVYGLYQKSNTMIVYETASLLMLNGLGIMGLRHAMSKQEKKIDRVCEMVDRREDHIKGMNEGRRESD